MTFLERLQAHKGSLIRLKTELYWYVGGNRGWDGSPSRACLLLEAEPPEAVAVPRGVAVTAAAADTAAPPTTTAAALLLIDGRLQWVWVADDDVEVISDIP